MDHTQAIELKAVERYMLNELDDQQRDEFEEHMFMCAECASELKACSAFCEGAVEVFRSGRFGNGSAQPAGTEAASQAVTGSPSWKAKFGPWLQWPSFVPSLAALTFMGICGLQWLQMNRVPAIAESAVSTISPPAVVRGPEDLKQVPAGRVTRLDVEFVASHEFRWKVVNRSGSVMNAGGEGRTNDRNHFAALVGPFRKTGEYSLILTDPKSGVESEYRFSVTDH